MRSKVLITGAAGDIGRATALKFASEGATLILTDIDPEGGQQSLDALGEHSGSSVFLPADLSKEETIVSLFEQLRKHVDRLDVLVNIAGGDYELVSRDTSEWELGWTVTPELYCQIVQRGE